MINWPGAGVDHRSASLIEPVAKLGVALVHVVGVGVAAVQLDVVNVPAGEGVGILLQLVTSFNVHLLVSLRIERAG